MAEERDPQVSRRYRELGGEEPPPALDQAILAASRRSALSRRRWYVPLAVAAAAVLAVGIALHVERERPATAVPAEAPRDAREPQPRAEGRSKEERNEAREAPAAPAVVPQTAPAARVMSDDAPERLLERIAELRKQGRHEEADKALEDFRRRYPDYRIPDK
jgi:hypothetical protein